MRLDGGQSAVLVLTRRCLRLLLRWRARGGGDLRGLELTPAQGPLLVCSNHVSNFDPLVYGACVPRVLHVLTKVELYRNPVLRWYLTRCNSIPVRRGQADRLALRGALAVLRSGGALLLFPEGHRSRGQGLLPFAAGVGYLALRSGAQVLPCAVWGTESILPRGRVWPRRGRVWVRVGEPYLPQDRDPAGVAAEIRRRVSGLLPPEYRGSADPHQLDLEDQGGVGGDA
ncbi:MAG: lysophospholipid acyltransferase family protein [Candidatus Dormibacteria bacterium]